MPNNPFHLAFQVTNLKETRHFYVDVLGCKEGRSTNSWIDFDFFGHQLSAHLGKQRDQDWIGKVDEKTVPVPHFGAVISVSAFEKLAGKLKEYNIQFIIEPYLRYEGREEAQWTMFVVDPSGNSLEFKAFQNPEKMFDK